MQFGMPTLIELKSPEENAALCHGLGLDFVELNMNLPEYQAHRLDAARLCKAAKEYGVYYTIHLDENLTPWDLNDRVAEAYTETVLQTIKTSRLLGVPVVNMHMNSGIWFTLPDRKVFLFDKYEGEYLRKLAAFRDACTAAAKNTHIKICVENCGDFETYRCVRKGLELLLESTAFALTFDVGHNAGAGYTDEPVILEHIDRLHHMHLHDASGRSDHLVLGAGDVDLPKYLTLAQRHNCRVVLEVKAVEGLRQSAEWLKARGYL